MKILVTGAGGQIGQEIVYHSLQQSYEIVPLTHQECDITNLKECNRVIADFQPNWVINAAAYTAVDKAEENKEAAFAVNRDGALNLAKACENHHIPLIHLSTDYVFDGHKNIPYLESDAPSPINVYGESKLAGEQAVQNECSQHFIIRVSGVFGQYGHNFVKTILRLAATQETLRIVDDQWTCPTPAYDIGANILQIITAIDTKEVLPQWGTYHYCSNEAVTWFEFTNVIIELAAKAELPITIKNIQPIKTIDLNLPARRPHNSVLDCHKILNKLFIHQPNWRQGLERVFMQMGLI